MESCLCFCHIQASCSVGEHKNKGIAPRWKKKEEFSFYATAESRIAL